MRIIHTSDRHLGHELHGFDHGVEHDAFLNWLARKLIDLNADALIVTGDIYDTVNPSTLSQQRLGCDDHGNRHVRERPKKPGSLSPCFCVKQTSVCLTHKMTLPQSA